MPTAVQTFSNINRIDMEIGVVRRELRKRGLIARRPLNDLSAASWQAAWDRNPDLHEREVELNRQRGIAQQARDARAHRAWVQQSRRKPAKRAAATVCPTCGQTAAAS